MLNIAVIEDSEVQRELITEYIKEWSAKTKTPSKSLNFSSAEQFLFEYNDHPEINLILLDIKMLRISGIELAQKLRQKDRKIIIIFITANSEYMQEGFDVEAFNYLLKPVKKEKLFECLTKAVTKQKEFERKAIILSYNNEKIKVYQDEILFVESISHKLKIKTINNTLLIRMSLAEIEKELDAEIFIKTHRAFLANLTKIKQIQKTTVVMEDGSDLPISKREYKNLNEKFIRFFIQAEK